jgi:hypothetical protein
MTKPTTQKVAVRRKTLGKPARSAETTGATARAKKSAAAAPVKAPARSVGRGAPPAKSPLHGLAAVASARAKENRAREARALFDTITRKIAAAEESFYEIGVALGRLREPAMFGALGFATFEEALASIPKLSREVAYRCLRIATHYDEATALALSQSKAIALLTYVEATPEPDDAQSLAEADASVGGVAISQQTTEGILRAAAEARPSEHRRARAGEAEAKRSAAALERRLRSALRVPVEVRAALRKKEWRLLVDVPAALAARLVVTKR